LGIEAGIQHPKENSNPGKEKNARSAVENRNVCSYRELDGTNVEVDRSFFVHGLDHPLAHRGQVIKISPGVGKNDKFWGNRWGILQVAQHYREADSETQTEKPKPEVVFRVAAVRLFFLLDQGLRPDFLFQNGAQIPPPEPTWGKKFILNISHFTATQVRLKKFTEIRPICWQELSPRRTSHL
jgi:hypothetical protein